MQEAPRSLLNPEQKAVLRTTHHFLESATIYFRSVLPVVDEVDERLLRALVNLAESCMHNLALFFPELAEELKKRRAR